VTSAHVILSIETSNPSAGNSAVASASVALVRHTGGVDVQPIGVESLRPTGRHDDDLMPAIDRLLKACGMQPTDIDRVAVSIGPGGYTGLRVAVTTANVIAATCSAEVIGVPTAEALIRRATCPQPCVVCLAVKGRSVWSHPFPEGEASVVAVENLAVANVRGVVADQFLPDDIRTALLDAGVVVERPVYDAVAVAEASIARDSCGPAQALYAREPEAVTRWRAKRTVR